MQLLRGSYAKNMLEAEVAKRLKQIEERKETVRIALFRVGAEDDDLQYEKMILRACDRLGIEVEENSFDAFISEEELCCALTTCNSRPDIDGILLFRPLPKHLQTEQIYHAVSPDKDIDGMLLEESSFVPCTPEACVYLLKAYGIDPAGKRCVVIGRSPVVGKPLAKLLTGSGADVTVCHSKTRDIRSVTKKAEILFVACGKPEMVTGEYLAKDQIVVDIGFHRTEEGFCGDVLQQDAELLAAAYTPVPGGVGAVTLPVLLLHAVQSHERRKRK